ncbi:MaoC family dehydratase N-terminal domain-containing protein [Sinobaca sp. H24]|uniref:FAS1-like dehydratase domain-containing protein n=1 Tax=Sinobaca sp. H24 TaxID=2923376 RepID=UPI00207A9B1E|nr:MaoC family dehydratase N-terminal domain-containing protein [Sinobaca sp. H24]
MYWEDFLHVSAAEVENTVSSERVDQFKEALGFPGMPEGHVPPTFVRTFSFGDIQGLIWPDAGMIHAEQEYDYYRPLVPEETLFCSQRIDKVVRKTGRSGEMAFIYLTQTGKDSAEQTVFISRRVLVWKAAGRRSEGVPE